MKSTSLLETRTAFLHFRVIPALLACLALAACGGGGSSSPSEPSAGNRGCQPDTTDADGNIISGSCGGIDIAATTQTLPLNVSHVPPNLHGPTQVEVKFHWLDGYANPVSGPLNVTIAPDSIAKLSLADDPTTPADESATPYSSLTLNTDASGTAMLFVNSEQTAGTARLGVQGNFNIDGGGLAILSNSATFTVTNQPASAPKSLQVTADLSVRSGGAVYAQGSSGNTGSLITATLLNGDHQPVADPLSGNSGYDNITFEILGDSNSGATLSANSIGGPVSGTRVSTVTRNGMAQATFESGSVTGPVLIRAMADGADNDVDNGITDPLEATATVVVSDGKLFKLVVSSPDIDAVRENRVDGAVAYDESPAIAAVSADRQGSYSVTMSVSALDRQGNPVLPNTPIEFGAIDGPVTGFPQDGSGSFLLAGSLSDAPGGGNAFTALGMTRSSSVVDMARPGDTLLIFDPDKIGLEGARAVQTTDAAGGVIVEPAFDAKSAGGTSVGQSPTVLPYVMGRSVHVTMAGATRTDAAGLAHVTFSYPIAQVGQAVDLWAQGAGADGQQEASVGAVAQTVFAGIAPAHLAVSPVPFIANTRSQITVCVRDDAGSAIPGARVTFAFRDLGAGNGAINGAGTSGTLLPTGLDGCSKNELSLVGIVGHAGSPQVEFGLGDAAVNSPVAVMIQSAGDAVLQASPSSQSAAEGGISMQLKDAMGVGIGGVAVDISCSAGIALLRTPSVTDVDGRTEAFIDASALNAWGSAGGGRCSFSTTSLGIPPVSIDVTGVNLCRVHASSTLCSTRTLPTEKP